MIMLAPSQRAVFRRRALLLQHPLPTEQELTLRWTKDDPVVVSIACATFNHADLIEDSIHGFLCQRTDFRFEIIIRDDASTDGTRRILEDFQRRYPSVIRLILHHQNTFSLGKYPFYDFAESIRGEFVAFCEGDDFWICDDKIQQQVDQLRRLPGCVASVAGTIMVDSATASESVIGLTNNEMIYSGVVSKYHHTSTYLIRSEEFQKIISRYFISNGLYGDSTLSRFLIHNGTICTLPEVVSVYWIHEKGIWNSLSPLEKAQEEFRISLTVLKVAPLSLRVREIQTFIDLGADLNRRLREAGGVRNWLFSLSLLPFLLSALLNRTVSYVRRHWFN